MKWLVTGAAGFIGTHLAGYLAASGHECILADNFHRGEPRPDVLFLDVRRHSDVEAIFQKHPDIGVVAHLAGQVSLVASLSDPRYDFETNALGTFNILEAMRRFAPGAKLIFSSTNKVYGDLAYLTYEETLRRYSLPGHPHGLGEELPIELHGGYSCSKGAADQYVRDYAKVYGLKTVSLRQSSIYGGDQRATEDQGWVAWFVRMAVQGTPFRICGNGKQVRDLLHVQDLCGCFSKIAALPTDSPAWGEAFNIGGGPHSSLSLLELFDILQERFGLKVCHTSGLPRLGDQKVFIANSAKAHRLLHWKPETCPSNGLAELVGSTRQRLL